MLKLVYNLDQVELVFVEVLVSVLVYGDTHLQLFPFRTSQRRMDMFLFAQVYMVTNLLLVEIL